VAKKGQNSFGLFSEIKAKNYKLGLKKTKLATLHVISIVACCHGAKLCAYTARDFQSQQNGVVTRM